MDEGFKFKGFKNNEITAVLLFLNLLFSVQFVVLKSLVQFADLKSLVQFAVLKSLVQFAVLKSLVLFLSMNKGFKNYRCTRDLRITGEQRV